MSRHDAEGGVGGPPAAQSASRADDPFGAAEIRAATLAAWTTSPTRFREDANLEEDHARGYYRDRVIVELAQNAADAAAHAGSQARLLLRLANTPDGGALLTAANTGAPLTASGVQALASMRASAKQELERALAVDDPAGRSLRGSGGPARAVVGRFGVGFAGVRAISDEIAIASTTGAVGFSATRARDLLARTLEDARHAAAETEPQTLGPAAEASPTSHATTWLAQALDRPAADLPILRLPFALDPAAAADTGATLPPGYDTLVAARLSYPQGRDLVARLLAEVDDVLLLALPALGEVRIEVEGESPRVISDVEARWRTVRVAGHHTAADLADRPHEERSRNGWSITWAVRRASTASTASTDLLPPPPSLTSRVVAREVEDALDLASDNPRRQREGVAGTVEPGGAPGSPGEGASRTATTAHRHVIHAPTPTDEPCTLPALLIATFPLDPSRRHVAPGAATDALVAHAGDAYADLVERLAAEGVDPLPFVPLGLPAGRLDAALHTAAHAALPSRGLLTPVSAATIPVAPIPAEHVVSRLIHPDEPTRHVFGQKAEPGEGGVAFAGWREFGDDAGGPGAAGLLAPREAQAIAGPIGHDARALAALAPALVNLVAIPPGPDAFARIRALGVAILDLADAVDALPLDLTPERWRTVYDALAPHAGEPGVADALAGLPVPLADGRTTRGPRGLVILPPPSPPAGSPLSLTASDNPRRQRKGGGGEEYEALSAFAPFGLRIVHPDAAHLLLTRLGATEATPRTLLAHPAVRAAVAAASRTPDPAEARTFADATLALVSAALADGATPPEIARAHPWLGSLPLEDDDGEPTPARDLTLPGSWAAAHLDALQPTSPALIARHTPDVLRAVGVRDGLVTITVRDVVAEPPLTQSDEDDDAPEALLDGWSDYLDYLAETLAPGTYVGDLPAVADLDAVADHAWPAALAHIAADQDARSALLNPVRGNAREAASYTAWWLRDLLGAPFAAPGARVPFLPPAPAEVGTPDDAAHLGAHVLAALGAVGDLDTLEPADWERYLDGLPPSGTLVPLDDALTIWRGLAALATRLSSPDAHTDGRHVDPERIPVLRTRTGERPVARIAAADAAAVTALPMWAQLADVIPAPSVAAAQALADLLDLPLRHHQGAEVEGSPSTSRARTLDLSGGSGRVVGEGDGPPIPTPPAMLALVPTAPVTYLEHESLTVTGNPVDWWVTPDGLPHAVTTAGLARALAQAAGRWDARSAIEIVLTDPTRAADLAAERAWDAP